MAATVVSAVEEPVFGTTDPSAIADLVSEFCSTRLGSSVSGGLFYVVSAGCVVGLRLADGRDVVVKAYQERWTEPFLTATSAVQRHLAGEGFPCPTPLAGPLPLHPERPNQLLVESFLYDSGMRPYTHPEASRISATGLARMIDLCRDVPPLPALSEHPLGGNDVDDLYPTPHTPLFDFEASREGADWIDEFARAGAAQRKTDQASSPPVIAHADWCARNVRVSDADDGPGRIEAVFDWDSVAYETESAIVGQAAATWPVTSEPGAYTFPTPDGIDAFLGHYQDASSAAPWSETQRRAAAGSAVWVLAYIARCEHALAWRGWKNPVAEGGRTRLRADGEAILALYG